MLQVDRLSKSYIGEPLFSEVSFSLQPGEKCALIGRNGSGKTTILRILKGEEVQDFGTIHKPRGYRLGFLEQHIQFSQPTVLEEVMSGPLEKQPYEMERILLGIGFQKEQFNQAPQTLSGGFHLRLKLAKLLASPVDCLVLDEPTNYLDIIGLRWLERYLQQWPKECILVSHERSFLDPLVTHTMGLHRKKLKKYAGNTEVFYQKIVEEEEIHEKTLLNLEKKKKHLETYIERFGAKASKASQAKSKAKALEKIPALAQLSAQEDLLFSFAYAPFFGKKMISLEDVSFAYNPLIPLIEDFSFFLEKEQKIGIIGKNGLGKSTLLRLIAQDLSPSKGSITRADPVKIGYFGQTHIDRLPMDFTIEEEISKANPKLNDTQVRNICGQMMFSGDTAKKKISLLSGGERSRVLLGKIIASSTNLLLLDEPTHHLDTESIEALVEAINTFEGSCIFVTHSEELLKRIQTDALLVCSPNSQQLFLGSYEEFLAKDGWQEKVMIEEIALTKKTKEKPIKLPSHAIITLEKKISQKEVLLQELYDSLQQVAQKDPRSSKITELTKKASLLRAEIDTYYEELEKL